MFVFSQWAIIFKNVQKELFKKFEWIFKSISHFFNIQDLLNRCTIVYLNISSPLCMTTNFDFDLNMYNVFESHTKFTQLNKGGSTEYFVK